MVVVGEEDASVCPGSLVAEVVWCELRSMMLDHGWRCQGENIYVDLTFDQNEERTHMCAVNVVQCFWHFCPCLGIHCCMLLSVQTNVMSAPELETSIQI
jgi:hypothetical protein